MKRHFKEYVGNHGVKSGNAWKMMQLLGYILTFVIRFTGTSLFHVELGLIGRFPTRYLFNNSLILVSLNFKLDISLSILLSVKFYAIKLIVISWTSFSMNRLPKWFVPIGSSLNKLLERVTSTGYLMNMLSKWVASIGFFNKKITKLS